MIRKIYLLVSILILVGSFAIPTYFMGSLAFPIGLTFYCIYALLSLVVSYVSWQMEITSGNVGDVIIPPFGFLTFGFKRVYYSDLGYFWIRKSSYVLGKQQVHLYEQRLFVMYKIGEILWENDIEKLKSEIKNKLEEIYKEKLEVRRQKDWEKKIWNDWNGTVDKKSERDNKLNELGV